MPSLWIPLVASLSLGLGDEPWSRFRGPNGSGIAEGAGVPQVFDGTTRRWRCALPEGKSSPVLTQDRVLLTGHAEGRLYTLAVDRSNGAIRWRREAPRTRTTEVDARNGPASPSAAVDAERVVVFFPDYGLLAYDLEGSELWRVPLGPFDNLYGMGASPILADGRVFLACDQQTGSYLLALDADDGEELWRVPRPEAKSGHCTPILHRPEGGAGQLILPGSFLLDAYDPASGERLWWSAGLSFEMKSVPVLYKGVVYINGYGSPMNQPGNQVEVPRFEEVLAARDADGDGTIAPEEMPESRASAWFDFVDLDADGGLVEAEWAYLRAALASQNGLLAIRAGGPGARGDRTAEATLWSYRRSVPQLPSPLIYGDVLYLLNDQGGLLVTLDPASGEVIERGRLDRAQDAYYASPVAGDGKVILVSETGIVSVLGTGGGIEPLATSELGEIVHATPALSRGEVYLRTEAALMRFGPLPTTPPDEK